jgi:hypothetical protein
MILDSFLMIPPSGFSQVNAYTSVYKEKAGKGQFDEWHTSPDQLVTIIRKKLNYIKHQTPVPSEPHEIDNLVNATLFQIKDALDRHFPVVMLLAYDEASRKPHASGTHWVVVRGYNILNGQVNGFYTLDPWRGWMDVPHREPVSKIHFHKNPAALPDPPGPMPKPEIVASWQRNPARFTCEASAEPLDLKGQDFAAHLFRGARTDGTMCILTVPPGEPPEMPGITVPPQNPFPGMIKKVPNWKQFLKDALAGNSNFVPAEFANALPEWKKPDAPLKVHRTDAPGKSYKLLVWPVNNGMRLIAWFAGPAAAPVIEGVSAVSKWPVLKAPGHIYAGPTGLNFLPANTSNDDWPERKKLKERIELHLNGGGTATINRLIWEPCPLSMSPAMPFYEVMMTLQATDVLPEKNIKVLALPRASGPDLIFFKVARGSKAGG